MRLIKNEWIKIWSQKNAWAMLIVILGAVALLAGINKYYEEDLSTSESRKKANEESIAMYEEWLGYEGIGLEEQLHYQEQIAFAQYRIDHDLVSNQVTTSVSFVSDTLVPIQILGMIFTIVIAAGIVSSEFSTGTIKMLLTRPIARWKILLSKLVTSILYGASLFIAGIVFAYLLGAILFGMDSTVSLQLVNGVVTEVPIEYNIFEGFGYTIASLLMTVLFAFMLGSLFASSTLAVSLSLVMLLMGSTISLFISRYEFAKYLWFVNDLSYYAPGSSPLMSDVTFEFALIVNIVYAVLFLVIPFGYFTKRDVTA